MFTQQRIINDQEQLRLSEKIAEVEKTTDAELVTVLAQSSDNYNYLPMLWAAFIALLSPIIALFFYPLPIEELVISQLGIFIVLALLFRTPILQYRLIPKSVRYWRASNMARRQFLENNLHHTNGETGFLIFVSEAEQYIEIIADRGISSKIDNEQWQTIIADFTLLVKAGKTLEGFIQCVEQCGELLAKHIPASETNNPNELPNHLVII